MIYNIYIYEQEMDLHRKLRILLQLKKIPRKLKTYFPQKLTNIFNSNAT